ncbi:MAG: FlgD immunoglobulin-like domain containing protein [bacterium]|nr:FlgD immunoglobulin-like domain containing protein [bacterium]
MLYLKRLMALLPLFCFTSLMSSKANAFLIPKEEAIKFVIDSIVEGDTLRWVYMIPDSIPQDTVIRDWWGLGEHKYSNPYPWSWFFFIDDHPPANFAHECRYVFIEYPHIDNTQSYTVIYEMMPPCVPDSLEKIYPHGIEENSNSSGSSKMIKVFSNPFTEYIYIEYQLPHKSDVSLRIYDILGGLVKKLMDGQQELGYHRICWDRTNDEGIKVAPGTYFFKLTFNHIEIVKLVVLH